MRLLDFLRRRKKLQADSLILQPEPEKSIAELIEDYRAGKMCVSMAPQTDKGFWEDELRRTEDKIIAKLPNGLQKSALMILQRYRFDFREFLEKEDWTAPLKEVARDICHFLHYGSPYPMKPQWAPLPFSGEDFFLHLLESAKKSNKTDSAGRIGAISLTLKAAVETKELFGHSFVVEDLQNIGMRVIVVFAGELHGQAGALMDIFCEVEGGEQFVREIITKTCQEQ